MSNVSNHLNHSTWECKYHVVFTPKYRKKELYGFLRKELKDVFHRLAKQKECSIEEGYLMPDHVHMLISIPPKHSVSSVLGFLKEPAPAEAGGRVRFGLRKTLRASSVILLGISSGRGDILSPR